MLRRRTYATRTPAQQRRAQAPRTGTELPGYGPLPEPFAPHPDNLNLLTRIDRRFDDFCDQALAAQGKSPLTVRWYRESYRSFRKFLLEHAGLSPARFERQVFAVDEWARWNRARGLAPTTVNALWRGLRAFFTDWSARDATANPFRWHQAPGLPARLPRALPTAQCRRVLEVASNSPWLSAFERHRALALVGLCLYAGLRRGELLRLQVSDVDLAEGTIRILKGKGRWGGKDRVVYVAPELHHILIDYLRERPLYGENVPEFLCSRRTGPLSEATLRRIFLRLQRVAGFAFSPHVLRHSFVTHMLKSGIPLQVARDLAGHNDIGTTMGYLKVFDDEKREQMKKLRY